MWLESALQRDGELLLVEATITGPAGVVITQLVLDTGASATTLTPALVQRLGYSRTDGFRASKVTTAVGEEHGYWLRVADFTALGVITPNFAVDVSALPHAVDGLLGMNFLRHFNVEIRPVDLRIRVELISQSGARP